MRKTIFATLAIALVALTAGCSKEELLHDELTLAISEITDNTAIVKCTFDPKSSSTYQLRVGEAVTEEYSAGQAFFLNNLQAGKNHTVVATIFDATHKQVGTVEKSFRTTGVPDNKVPRETEMTPRDPIEIEVTDDSEESVTVTCSMIDDYSYQLSCNNGGKFSETGTFTTDKTLTLSNLKSGTQYTITTTVYPTSGEPKALNTTFTKK